MSEKLIIVGGLPEPIGGVTTFLRRLLFSQSDDIDCFVDIYPGTKKQLPKTIADKVIYLQGKLKFLAWYNRRRGDESVYLFNFSGVKSLLIFAFMHKAKTHRWALVLHPGNLALPGSSLDFIIKRSLKKFDTVYALSDNQESFFKSLDFENIIITKSYCPPVLNPEVTVPHAFSELRQNYKRLFIMSGYPKDIYHFEHFIEFIKTRGSSSDGLAIFIYGPGELREKLKDMMHTHDFLHVFDSQSEDLFNQCLAQSDCLLRLNSVDSFGIAVADAITLDVPVVASDVCERFPGAVIVSDFDYDTIDLAIEQALATKQSKKLAVSKRFYFDLEPLISSDAKN